MNSFDHAQKGFKTFVVTLTLSLVAFSVLYYFLSNKSEADINNNNVAKETAASASYVASASPFEDLANKKIDVPKRAVLAGSTVAGETDPNPIVATGSSATAQTSASVPNTGSTEVTIAFIMSGIFLLIGFYVLYLNPRKLALQSFERKFDEF